MKFPDGSHVYCRGEISFFGIVRATATLSNGEVWVLCESYQGTKMLVREEELRFSKHQNPLEYSKY